MNIILCGLPMSGKSFLGVRLAEQLRYQFVDTDRLIEQEYADTAGSPLTCREISLKHGEKSFRAWEKEVIKSLADQELSVIAVGGGTLGDPSNVQVLKSIGTLIYLKTDIGILLNRLRQKPSLPSYIDPLNPEESYKELAKHRLPIYEACADFIVEFLPGNENQIMQSICTFMEKGEKYGKQ